MNIFKKLGKGALSVVTFPVKVVGGAIGAIVLDKKFSDKTEEKKDVKPNDTSTDNHA